MEIEWNIANEKRHCADSFNIYLWMITRNPRNKQTRRSVLIDCDTVECRTATFACEQQKFHLDKISGAISSSCWRVYWADVKSKLIEFSSLDLWLINEYSALSQLFRKSARFCDEFLRWNICTINLLRMCMFGDKASLKIARWNLI